MSFHDKTVDLANGKWRGILITLGLPENCLKDKHGPCPLCEKKDGFRWDNRDGRGTYICTCGSGDGMRLAMEYTGRSFADLAKEIDGIVGRVQRDSDNGKPEMTEEQRRAKLRDAWRASRPVEPGDLVHKYLGTRGVDEMIYPTALRFAPALRDGNGGVRPAMLAMVGVPGQARFVSMHRTFLRGDGMGKAEIEAPRKLMPGHLPDGACVMLGDYVPGGPLGVAEGIETALSASALFGMPVWSTINTAIMARWFPPEGCTEVSIFADNDPKFGGQAAAFTLAHRLAVKQIAVTVHIPPQVGADWNDVHMARIRAKRAQG